MGPEYSRGMVELNRGFAVEGHGEKAGGVIEATG
jgi:hypothetical protein